MKFTKESLQAQVVKAQETQKTNFEELKTLKIQKDRFEGQAKVYYSPEYRWLDGISFMLGGGQYLAGDKGFSFGVAKLFDSGASVVACATKTDMSVEEYGEGSFTKGFRIDIPFDVMAGQHSRVRSVFQWEPLTRDGGQTLKHSPVLRSVTADRAGHQWRRPTH